MALKTDYKDDILDAEKNTKRKYRIINNSDGTISLEDVTVYSQTGSSFGADALNEITREINTQNSKTDNIESGIAGSSISVTTTSGEYISVSSTRFIRYDFGLVCYLRVDILKAIGANNNNRIFLSTVTAKYDYVMQADVISSNGQFRTKCGLMFKSDDTGIYLNNNVALAVGERLMGTILVPVQFIK